MDIQLPNPPAESSGEAVVTLRDAGSATGRVTLTVHLPASGATGVGVVIAPGGGYRIVASDHEGLQMARWLNRAGIAAFVLRYRLAPDHTPADALEDAALALDHVRTNAAPYGVDAARVGMLGFSAGGHLASAAGTRLPAAQRPAFLALVYPAIAGDLFGEAAARQFPSTHTAVDPDTPATFLIHTHEDDVVSPRHSLRFYDALLDAGVPAEFHVFAAGGHGLGLAPGDPDLGQWPQLLLNWLRRLGLLQAYTRASVTGTVTLGGDPLFWGWVTFNPLTDPAPPAVAYLGWRTRGGYAIDATHGPTPGPCSVTVHRVAQSFDAPESGAYSMADAERYDWLEGGQPVVVTIASGHNVIDIPL